MRSFTAMILDDHYIVRQGLLSIASSIPSLSIVGHYGRSRELIDAMAARQPDILLLDFSLHPDDVDGSTLIRSIKRCFPSVKIIVVSAHAKASIVSLAMRAGADGFCSKDSSIEELTTAARRVMIGRKHVPYLHSASKNSPGDSPKEPQTNCSDGDLRHRAFDALTLRECEVINLFLMGMSILDISRKLSRDRKTISGHKQSAYRKLGISSDAEIFNIRHLLE